MVAKLFIETSVRRFPSPFYMCPVKKNLITNRKFNERVLSEDLKKGETLYFVNCSTLVIYGNYIYRQREWGRSRRDPSHDD